LQKILLTDINPNGTLSVLSQELNEDGTEISNTHREALIPGDFNRAHAILPEDLYKQVYDLWTPEIVQAYEDSQLSDIIETFEDLKNRRLGEINAACEAVITVGMDISTSQGVKHFSLASEDQMNITALQMQLEKAQAGLPSSVNLTKGIPYHADGELCRYWSPEDFVIIAEAAVGHIFYHQTYCNHLRTYISRIEDIAELKSVQYGMQLPDDLTASLMDLLGVPQNA